MTNVREVTGMEFRRGSPNSVPSPEIVKARIMAIDNPKAQALCAILYLTGSRITEIVGGKSRYKDKKTKEKKERQVRGFRPEMLQKSMRKGITLWRFEGLEVIKQRKKIDTRTAVVAPWHNDLVEFIRDYMKHMPLDKKLFDITRFGAWKMLINTDKQNPLWCHYFRHAHVTHLIREGGMNHVMAGQDMRWKNISHLSAYTKYDVKDIEDHYLKMVSK